jgi:hypothetical protein
MLFAFADATLMTPGINESFVNLPKTPIMLYIVITLFGSLIFFIFLIIDDCLSEKVTFGYKREFTAFAKGTLLAWIAVLCTKIL